MFLKIKRIEEPFFNQKGNFNIIGDSYVNEESIMLANVKKVLNPGTNEKVSISEIVLTSGDIIYAKGDVEL